METQEQVPTSIPAGRSQKGEIKLKGMGGNEPPFEHYGYIIDFSEIRSILHPINLPLYS